MQWKQQNLTTSVCSCTFMNVRKKWLLEKLSVKFRVKLRFWSKRGAVESNRWAWKERTTGWRSSLEERSKEQVRDERMIFSVILSREKTVGHVRVTVRGVSRRVRFDLQKIVEIGGLARLLCFVDDWDNFVVMALIDFEPMQRFENKWNMGEYRGILETARSAELRINWRQLSWHNEWGVRSQEWECWAVWY